MKKLSAMVMALALCIMSSPAAYPQASQTTNAPPPVAPALVREGDFATRLVSALEIGTAENETEAETMLASAGIAPKNGWISDYPVTPDILGELEDTVAAAADSNRLPLGKDQALEALESLSAELGLSVVAHTSEEYAEAPPPVSPQYTPPTEINNYYYREGPPVVTYYPPPPDYLYLYAWVPYPFWCSRFFFSGFFILHDFHRVVSIHSRVVVVSNHFFHRHHRRFFRVDPVKRRGGRSFRAVPRRTYGGPLFTAEARRGARSILQRSYDRIRSSTGLVERNSVVSKSPIKPKGLARTQTARQMPAFDGRSGARAQDSPSQNLQRFHRDSARPFTAQGKSQGRPLGPPASRGKDSSKTARQMPAFNDRAGARTQMAPQENFKAVPKGSGTLLRPPGRSEGKSPSSLPSMAGRGFPGGFLGGSRGFSGKSPRSLPGGGTALKGF